MPVPEASGGGERGEVRGRGGGTETTDGRKYAQVKDGVYCKSET